MSGESYEAGQALNPVYAALAVWELESAQAKDFDRAVGVPLDELCLAYTALTTSGKPLQTVPVRGFGHFTSWLDKSGSPILLNAAREALQRGVPLLDSTGGLTFDHNSVEAERIVPQTTMIGRRRIIGSREIYLTFGSKIGDGFEDTVGMNVHYNILPRNTRDAPLKVPAHITDVVDAERNKCTVDDTAISNATKVCATEKEQILRELADNSRASQLLAVMLLSLEQAVGEQLPFKKVYEQGFQLPDFRKNPRHVINYIPSGLQ